MTSQQSINVNAVTDYKNNSIDLILTDPTYIISHESGMNTHYNNVQANEANNVEFDKNL